AGPHQAVLRTSAVLRGENLKTVGEFTVEAGQTVPFTLTYAPSHVAPPDPVEPAHGVRQREQFWISWTKSARVEPGERHGAVLRSLITLKPLTYGPTGGIVAAP